MKNASIKSLLPDAFPTSKTGFYNEIQAPKVKISPRGFSYGFEAVASSSLHFAALAVARSLQQSICLRAK